MADRIESDDGPEIETGYVEEKEVNDDYEPPHQWTNLFWLALAFGITFAAQSGESPQKW